MKIETKFNVGEIHFCIYGNEIRKIRIVEVKTRIKDINIMKHPSLTYTCVDVHDGDEIYFQLNEYEIYENKEQLLQFINNSMEAIDEN